MTQSSSQSAAGGESLAQRHLVEETFHDQKAHVAAPPARTDFYPEWMGDEHMEMLLRAAGPLAGKRVLDFGCGRGETSRLYAQRGAVRVTMLTPGMRHTAFTDDLLSNASSDAQRARYAGYLRTIRAITLRFFELALNASTENSVCGTVANQTYTQCFQPTGR